MEETYWTGDGKTPIASDSGNWSNGIPDDKKQATFGKEITSRVEFDWDIRGDFSFVCECDPKLIIPTLNYCIYIGGSPWISEELERHVAAITVSVDGKTLDRPPPTDIPFIGTPVFIGSGDPASLGWTWYFVLEGWVYQQDDADRYWVLGDGTYDAADTTHWSAASGGAGGASVPAAADNIFVDNGSDILGAAFQITMAANSAALGTITMNCTDAAATLAVVSYTLHHGGAASIGNIVSFTTGTWTADGALQIESTGVFGSVSAYTLDCNSSMTMITTGTFQSPNSTGAMNVAGNLTGTASMTWDLYFFGAYGVIIVLDGVNQTITGFAGPDPRCIGSLDIRTSTLLTITGNLCVGEQTNVSITFNMAGAITGAGTVFLKSTTPSGNTLICTSMPTNWGGISFSHNAYNDANIPASTWTGLGTFILEGMGNDRLYTMTGNVTITGTLFYVYSTNAAWNTTLAVSSYTFDCSGVTTDFYCGIVTNKDGLITATTGIIKTSAGVTYITQAGSTLGSNSNYTLQITGSLSATGGTLNLPNATGTCTMAGSTWTEGGTVNANSGIVQFTRGGGLTTTLGSNATSFYGVTVSNGSTIAHTSYAVTCAGALTIGGGATGVWTPTTGVVTVGGTLTINTGAIMGANSAWGFDCNGAMTIVTTGTFNSPRAAGTMNVAGNLTGTATMTWTQNGVTTVLDGTTQALTGFSTDSTTTVLGNLSIQTSTMLTWTGVNRMGGGAGGAGQNVVLTFNMTGAITDGGSGIIYIRSTNANQLICTSMPTSFNNTPFFVLSTVNYNFPTSSWVSVGNVRIGTLTGSRTCTLTGNVTMTGIGTVALAYPDTLFSGITNIAASIYTLNLSGVTGAVTISGNNLGGSISVTTGGFKFGGSVTNTGDANFIFGSNSNYTLDFNNSLNWTTGTLNLPNATGSCTVAGASYVHGGTVNTNSGKVEFDGTGTQSITTNAKSFYNLSITNASANISFLSAITVTNLSTINAGVDIILSANFTTLAATWGGTAIAPITFASSVVGTIRGILIQTGNKSMSYVSTTNCYLDLQQGAADSIANLTVDYANDGDGANFAAIVMRSITSGTYDAIYVTQATYGIAFITSACTVTISNLTIEECAKGDPTNYASGGTMYLSNHAHVITLTTCLMDCEHIVFAGANGRVDVTESDSMIGCSGNSITQGSQLHGRFWNKFAGNDPMLNQWPKRLSGKITNYFCLNEGEGGNVIADVNTRISGALKQKPEILIIGIGSNDAYYIDLGSETYAQAIAAYQSLFAKIQNAGQARWYVLAIVPRESAAVNIQIVALNAWLSANVASYGGTYIPETYSNMIEGGGDTTLKNAYNSGDGTHPNATGYEQMATDIATYIIDDGARTIARYIDASCRVKYNDTDNNVMIALNANYALSSIPVAYRPAVGDSLNIYGAYTLTWDVAGSLSLGAVKLLDSNLTIDADVGQTITMTSLTIQSATTLNTSRNIVVSGLTTVTGALTINNTTASFRSAAAGATALTIAGAMTCGAATVTAGNIAVGAAGTLTMGPAHFTINGTDAGGFGWSHVAGATYTVGSSQVTSTVAHKINPHFWDYEVNVPGGTVTLAEDLQVDNELTITAGTFNTAESGGTSRNLIVSGATSITGTLTCNASTLTLAAVTINDGGLYLCNTSTSNISGNLVVGGGTSGQMLAAATCTVHISGTTTLNAGGGMGLPAAWTLNMDGNLLTSAGSISAPNNTTGFTYAGAIWKTPGSFIANGGTVSFDIGGSNTTTLGNASTSFYSISIAALSILNTSAASSYSLTVASTITNTGILTANGSTIDVVNVTLTGLASYMLLGTSSWTISGNFDNQSGNANWDGGTGTWNLDGTLAQNFNLAYLTINNLIISNSGVVDILVQGGLTLSGYLNATSTTARLDMVTNSMSATVTGSITWANGFRVSSAATGTGSWALIGVGTYTDNNAVLRHMKDLTFGGTTTLATNIQMAYMDVTATVNCGNKTLYIDGSQCQIAFSFNYQTSTVRLNGSIAQQCNFEPTGSGVYNLTIDNTAAVAKVTFSGNMVVHKALYLKDGQVDFDGGGPPTAVTLSGNYTVDAGVVVTNVVTPWIFNGITLMTLPTGNFNIGAVLLTGGADVTTSKRVKVLGVKTGSLTYDQPFSTSTLIVNGDLNIV